MSTAIPQKQASGSGSLSVWSHRANGGSTRTTEGAQSCVADRGQPVLDSLDWQLLDACRRDFPICERPFAEIARRLNSRAGQVLRRFQGLERCGVVNRVGPVPAPGSVGASTLAAMAVPKARLHSITEAVTRYPGVDHLCEREHEFNLWFALAAPNAGELYDTVADIRGRTGVEVLDLRLERDYCRDLEFPPVAPDAVRALPAATETCPPERCKPLDASDRRLLAAIAEGLPLTARPYEVVANRAGISEAQVIQRLKRLLCEGVIERMGVVVRHPSPGLGANALVVFDVSRDRVDMAGERLAQVAWVNQCYRRIERAPIWPYNLYCTLHDQDLAKLIGWVDEEVLVRCPQRAVLPRRA